MNNTVGERITSRVIASHISAMTRYTDHHVTKDTVLRVISLLSEAVAEEISEGHTVQLTDLVTFTPSFAPGRSATSIQDGSEIEIPDSVKVLAKPGLHIKDAARFARDDIRESVRDVYR